MNKEAYAAYVARGIDPDVRGNQELEMDKDYAALSSNGKFIPIEGNHNSIYTNKENAAIICNEIIQLLKELSY